MRPIDADELLEHLNACLTNGRPLSNLYDLSEIVSYVEYMPTVDTVKHGRWIASDYDNAHIRYTCSNCGLSVLTNSDYIKRHRYCYNCGAKMDGEVKHE